MRIRLFLVIAAAGACALIDASPAQAWCHNNYSPCSGRSQYGYGYQYDERYYRQTA